MCDPETAVSVDDIVYPSKRNFRPGKPASNNLASPHWHQLTCPPHHRPTVSFVKMSGGCECEEDCIFGGKNAMLKRGVGEIEHV